MAHLDLEPLLDQNIPWILDFQIQLPLDLRSLVPSSILRFHWTPPWMSPSVLVNHQENQAQHNPTGQRPLTCLHLPASLHHHNHNWTPSQLLTTSLQLLKTSEHIDDDYNNKRLCHLDLFEVVDKPLNQHLLFQHMVRAHTPSPRRTMEHPLFFSAFDVEDLDSSALPSGWKFENGYIQLTEQPKDYWEIKSGCLIRHHVVPRRTRFDPNKMSEKDKSHIPITLDKLDPTRVTVCTGPNEVRHYHDVIGDLSSATNKPWVGSTIFQINGATRQELGMTAYSVNALFFVDFYTHDDRPQWTESMDVDEIYGSVDEKHLCEEQRLLDDAHVSVDEATFVETFVPQNVLHSDLYDVSDPMHSPENVLASAESFDPANDLVTENANTFVNAQAPAETFVPVNVKAPVESFARASNVARPCLKYVMALSLLAGCAGDPLWPMVDKHHDWRDQCALGENSSATAHTGFHWIWVIFLFNLVFSVCCFCAALLMRRRWLEMDRARLELYRQNEYFRAEIRKLRNEIIDVDWQRQDLQLKVLDHDRIRSEEREEDQRVVRKASGLLDRILVELEILSDCGAENFERFRYFVAENFVLPVLLPHAAELLPLPAPLAPDQMFTAISQLLINIA
ncbi:unnamed protein product [Cladocopium goreaui]|uniref:Uncharacterized protein n=1 Tax=Cladocopium goreaui TaxID=2562237 RepID=A0A9P1G869_9DINO|nr:unnamed protein product [Cladocopium goreaui]